MKEELFGFKMPWTYVAEDWHGSSIGTVYDADNHKIISDFGSGLSAEFVKALPDMALAYAEETK